MRNPVSQRYRVSGVAQNRQVEIYRHGRDVEVLENPTEVSGEDVLPGFILNFKRVWT
jgi:Uma2 family endonuclease